MKRKWMEYRITDADRKTIPENYSLETRYLGYSEEEVRFGWHHIEMGHSPDQGRRGYPQDRCRQDRQEAAEEDARASKRT